MTSDGQTCREILDGSTAEGVMSGRARCLATLRGDPVDRIPAYTPTIACDVASKILGRPVHTGSPSLWYAAACAWSEGETAFEEFDAEVTESLIALNRALGIEVLRYGYRRSQRPTKRLDEWSFLYGDPEGVHQVWHWDPEVMNFHRTADSSPPECPEDWPRRAKARLASVERSAAGVREHVGRWEELMQDRLGDEMLVVGSGGGFSVGLSEAAMMACILEPGAVGDMLDCQLAVNLAQLAGFVARGIKVVLGGGDMADKNGPMYSPAVFRELMLPRLKTYAARCRELDLHYVWRTDGNIWAISDMLFEEAGIEGFGEVDFDASMTSVDLRKRFPSLTLWANASGDCLRRKSAEEVYEHSLTILRGSKGRRHFHGCSNTVLPGSPPENVLAMMGARDYYSRDELG